MVVAGLGTIVGIGIGFAMQTSILAVQNAVDIADMGMATSTALLARTLGGTVGTPLFGAVLAAGVPAHHATAAEFADALPWVFAAAVPGRPPRHPVRRSCSRSARSAASATAPTSPSTPSSPRTEPFGAAISV